MVTLPIIYLHFNSYRDMEDSVFKLLESQCYL